MALRATTGRDVRLIMVGGKGGVGKTTCASAIAMGLASGGRRVLLISSDPTPSLSDIYEQDIGSVERRLLAEIPLYGLEISAEMVLRKWKERFGPEIYEVVSSFADLDYGFVDYVGTAPGIEEEYMLYLIRESAWEARTMSSCGIRPRQATPCAFSTFRISSLPTSRGQRAST